MGTVLKSLAPISFNHTSSNINNNSIKVSIETTGE